MGINNTQKQRLASNEEIRSYIQRMDELFQTNMLAYLYWNTDFLVNLPPYMLEQVEKEVLRSEEEE